jgi:hypothetical protein
MKPLLPGAMEGKENVCKNHRHLMLYCPCCKNGGKVENGQSFTVFDFVFDPHKEWP